MNRLNKFRSFIDHPWLKKSYKKLNVEELQIAENFITKNATTKKDEFELAVNRMFLNQSKTKHWSIIVELLSCCNN